MEMKKIFLKSTLLLGSVFVLAACGSDETTTETTTEETSSVVESVSEETVVETVEEESIEEEVSEDVESVEEEVSEEEESIEEDVSEVEESAEEEVSEVEESAEEEESVSEEVSEEEESVSEEVSEEEESVSEEVSEEEESVSEEVSEEEESVSEEVSEEEESSEEAAEGLVDGEYTAVSNEDENGWSILHVITVKDGEVTDSNFDYTNAEGDLKSEDEEYNKMMEEKSGVSAADAMEELNNALVETQSADVDVVSGATSTSESFVKTSEALLAAAAEGNTDEINIDELGGDLQDGEYTLTTEADERGWAHQFTLVVKDGVIAESNYDMVNEAGDLKSEDEEYNANMEDGTGTSFATAVEELNAALVENQSVEDIEVVSGATSTSNAFLDYAKQLLDAAAEGNTDPIEAELVD